MLVDDHPEESRPGKTDLPRKLVRIYEGIALGPGDEAAENATSNHAEPEHQGLESLRCAVFAVVLAYKHKCDIRDELCRESPHRAPQKY